MMGEPRKDLDDESRESMAVRLREYFREEADELVAERESAVLKIEKSPEDNGRIDRVFRALHTIKGSGAACGMNDRAAFSHEIGTFFDLVRKGAITVKRDVIDLTLAARDQKPAKAVMHSSQAVTGFSRRDVCTERARPRFVWTKWQCAGRDAPLATLRE